MYTPRKLTLCTRKYTPPQTEKKTIHIQPPNSHFLGGFKKSKTVRPFRGFEPPTVFFETRLWKTTQGARRDRWKTSVSNSNPSPPGWWPSRPSPRGIDVVPRLGGCVCLGFHFYGSGNEKKKTKVFEVVGGVHSGSWRVNKSVCIIYNVCMCMDLCERMCIYI